MQNKVKIMNMILTFESLLACLWRAAIYSHECLVLQLTQLLWISLNLLCLLHVTASKRKHKKFI